eukprot:g5203.t2
MGLVPSTINAYDFSSGAWTRQSLWCENTASIECEEPVLREEESGEESVISFVLEVERVEGAGMDRIRSLSLQIFDSNLTETVGIIANNTVDGLWWTMNDDSAYVKIRWSTNDPTFFNNSWINEDVFDFAGGLASLETVPASSTPVCFSAEMAEEYDVFGSKLEKFMQYRLPEASTREILRSGFLNTFYTNGITGNPLRSVYRVAEPDGENQLLGHVLGDKALEYSLFPLNCAAGAEEGANVSTLANFLASPDLEVGLVATTPVAAWASSPRQGPW